MQVPESTAHLFIVNPIRDFGPKVSALVASINGLMTRMRQSIHNTQQFNADVSHQLRTPVSEIRALAELTARRCDDPGARRNLKEIERIAEGAGYTVQQLLTLAKTRHELVDTTAMTRLDLAEACRAECTDAISRIYQRGQELEFIERETDCPVMADTVMLRWLVQNLIENASQHAGGEAPYRGTIRVRVFQQDGAPALSVGDDGVGVDAHRLPRLTERFFRASPETPGSGLGLAIVDEIARAHGATGDLMAEDPLCTHQPGTFPQAALLRIPQGGYGQAAEPTLSWEDAARERMMQVPAFVRGMVTRAVESHCRDRGIAVVTPAVLDEIRSRMPIPRMFGR